MWGRPEHGRAGLVPLLIAALATPAPAQPTPAKPPAAGTPAPAATRKKATGGKRKFAADFDPAGTPYAVVMVNGRRVFRMAEVSVAGGLGDIPDRFARLLSDAEEGWPAAVPAAAPPGAPAELVAAFDLDDLRRAHRRAERHGLSDMKPRDVAAWAAGAKARRQAQAQARQAAARTIERLLPRVRGAGAAAVHDRLGQLACEEAAAAEGTEGYEEALRGAEARVLRLIERFPRYPGNAIALHRLAGALDRGAEHRRATAARIAIVCPGRPIADPPVLPADLGGCLPATGDELVAVAWRDIGRAFDGARDHSGEMDQAMRLRAEGRNPFGGFVTSDLAAAGRAYRRAAASPVPRVRLDAMDQLAGLDFAERRYPAATQAWDRLCVSVRRAGLRGGASACPRLAEALLEDPDDLVDADRAVERARRLFDGRLDEPHVIDTLLHLAGLLRIAGAPRAAAGAWLLAARAAPLHDDAPSWHADAIAALIEAGAQDAARAANAGFAATYAPDSAWRRAHPGAQLVAPARILLAAAPPRPGVAGTLDRIAEYIGPDGGYVETLSAAQERCGQPIPYHTRLQVTLQVTPDGRVDATVREPIAASAAVCLSRALRRWQLPPPGQELTIEVPVVWE